MIKKLVLLNITFICLVIMSSCSSKKEPPPTPEWLYEKDAITLRFKADRVLNMSEGAAHTLMVCVYQLKSDMMLDQLAANEDGIQQLLDCDVFDSSVRNTKRLIFHPGQDLTFVMDRLAGTKKMGFIAGYSKLQKERMVRIVDMPVLISKDNKTATVGKLKAIVNLGSEQIAAIQSY